MNLATYAKAFVGAVVAALSALVVVPDFGVRNIVSVVVAGLVSFSLVWAIPNAAQRSRARQQGDPPNLA